MAYKIIRPRHGIKSLWNTYKSRIYKLGEMLVESPESGVGSGPVNIKFGDGVTDYEKLPYAVLAPVDEVSAGVKNPVTSSAVKEEIVNLEGRPVNNNILINSNFANPVNQRRFTTLTISSAEHYLIDRWFSWEGTFTASENGFVLTGDTSASTLIPFYQRIERLPIGTYALSAKINGKVYEATLNFNNAYVDKQFEDGVWFVFSYSKNIPTFGIVIDITKMPSATIEWAKLEEGEVATPYVPRLYAEELQLCKRYYYVTNSSKGTADGYVMGISDNGQSLAQIFEFPVEMRVRPTVTIKSPIDGTLNTITVWNGDYNIANGKMAAAVISTKCFYVTSTTVNLAKGSGYYFVYTADAEL